MKWNRDEIRHENHISCSKNALKLIYSKVEFQKCSGGGSPDKGEEGWREDWPWGSPELAPPQPNNPRTATASVHDEHILVTLLLCNTYLLHIIEAEIRAAVVTMNLNAFNLSINGAIAVDTGDFDRFNMACNIIQRRCYRRVCRACAIPHLEPG